LLFERKPSKVILSKVEGYFRRLSWFDGVYPAASGAYHDFVGKLGHYPKRHLKNRFSPSRWQCHHFGKRREGFVFETFFDFASLREPYFWNYLEVSKLLEKGASFSIFQYQKTHPL
jgi:hypothetical protein